MMKIAECHIGSNIADYKLFGTPTVAVFATMGTYGMNNIYTYIQGYKACCLSCGDIFTFGRWFDKTFLTCPCCGKKHHLKGHEIIYTEKEDSIMPYRLRMTVIEFSRQIEIRLIYDGIRRSDNGKFEFVRKVKELFTLDIQNECAYWKQTVGDDIIMEKEIGYYTDMDELWQTSALSFYHFRHVIKKGDTFTELLRKLRECVNRKMSRKGYHRKHFYLQGREDSRLLGSILAIARKVRFWDAPVMPYSGYKAMKFHDWEHLWLKASGLPENWEQKTGRIMKQDGVSYQKALMQILELPDTSAVRHNLTYENLYALKMAYSLPDKDMAYSACQTFIEWENAIAVRDRAWIADMMPEYRKKVIQVCEFVGIFYKQYQKTMKWKGIERKMDKVLDTLKLWNSADSVTKKHFYQSQIPLSQLHDWLSIMVAKQKDREVIYDLPVQLKERLETSVGQFTFKCIERKSQLQQAAVILKNCSVIYSDRIGAHTQIVIVINEEGKLKAMLEIRDRGIYQAKLLANACVSKYPALNKACIDYAKNTGLLCKTKDIQEYD